MSRTCRHISEAAHPNATATVSISQPERFAAAS
jgi:hypothetical protein